MRLLVDTHCWLWYLLSPERLNTSAREHLQNPAHQIYFSAASAWEIVIKYGLGKLKLPLSPRQYIPSRLAALGHESLPITQEHTLGVEGLPAHHKDPFDRILIAQTLVEDLELVTADESLKRYEVDLLWAGSRSRS